MKGLVGTSMFSKPRGQLRTASLYRPFSARNLEGGRIVLKAKA